MDLPKNSLLHKVDLDWITPDAERVVARHARVSTKDPERFEYEQLLKYCIKHGHWSIFEQVCASFEIITTRAISPQILRHRSFTFQETSQRYCDPLDVLNEAASVCHEFEIRGQDLKNRQNSVQFEDSLKLKDFETRIQDVLGSVYALYDDLLSAGVAKECARNILPMCTPTRLHMMGTVRSWIFYVGIRASIETQKEHRLIAQGVGNKLRSDLPVICDAVISAAETENSLRGWLNL